ncbi:MAG: phospholipase D-like domain-containing protein [Planctomycetota bacterium]|nr:phospholipase D-like domain-containing protein [Planctomycetota bacterium]
MNGRPYLNYSNDDLYLLGSNAHSDGDEEVYLGVLKELNKRKKKNRSKRATQRLKDLKKLGPIETFVEEEEENGFPGLSTEFEDIKSIMLLTDHEINLARISDIESAKETVLFCTYCFNKNETELLDVLCTKAKEITVQVIWDRRSYYGSPRYRLEESDVEVFHEGKHHSKCLIVDGRIVYIGSANAHISNHDIALRVESQDLAAAAFSYLDKLGYSDATDD